MVTTTNRTGLKKYSSGESWDHSDTVDHVDQTTPIELADSGSLGTLSGGSSPALDTTITGVYGTQTVGLRAVVGIESDPSFSADYSFNYDTEFYWDDSASAWDVTVTVNWDTDPGAGNDVDVDYRVYVE